MNQDLQIIKVTLITSIEIDVIFYSKIQWNPSCEAIPFVPEIWPERLAYH